MYVYGCGNEFKFLLDLRENLHYNWIFVFYMKYEESVCLCGFQAVPRGFYLFKNCFQGFS